MSAGTIQAGAVLPLVTTVRNENRAAVNVSAASAMTFYIRKPNGKRLSVTPVMVSDGTNGEVQYVTLPETLDVPGVYYIQAAVVLGSVIFLSDTSSFLVLRNL